MQEQEQEQEQQQVQKRIMVSISTDLLRRLEAYEFVVPKQRSQLIVALLEEYVADLDADAAQRRRQQERRDRVTGWVGSIRNSGKKAADIILP